jgi:hypothetical protein
MEQEQAIKEWQDLSIEICKVEFDCGGDSMNNTDFHFYSNGKLIADVSQDLQDYVENIMYNQCSFYVNSDGHYQGERGVVEITLEKDYDDTYCFVCTKYATAEYIERYTIIGEVKLTPKQIDYINKYVSNIWGGSDDRTQITYKRDFILTDEYEQIENEIYTLIDDVAQDTIPDVEGEVEEGYQFTTNDDEKLEELTIEGDMLKIVVICRVTIFQDSD